MRLGVSLAQAGRLADPASVRSAATAAELVGYSSVWVADRTAAPGRPGAPEQGESGTTADISATLDPLTVLTYAAALTTRVRLGTSVLVAPWYRPALLARSLASLDVLSDGRLTVGLGLGWTLDAFDAVGVPEQELGRRLDDALDMLDIVWGGATTTTGGRDMRRRDVHADEPRAHDARTDATPDGVRAPDATTDGGGHAPMIAGPPRRRRPPVLLAAYTPEGLDRVARRADGWNPSGLPVEMLTPLWASVRDRAAGHGRDPDSLELVVRANLVIVDQPIDGERDSYAGTVEQVAADIADTRRAGAHEVILGLQGDQGLDETLDVYARIAEALDLTAPV